MYVLILTLFATATTPASITTAEFTSQRACFDAASAWKNQMKWESSNIKLSTVCMPK